MAGKLAVTGGTGKSGSVFLECLEEHKEKVAAVFPGGIRLLMRTPGKAQPWLQRLPQAELAIGVLTDEDYLDEALQGVDTLVHIAGICFSSGIVRAAVKNNVRRLILVHTTGIYSKYKEAGEEYRKIDAYVKKICQEHQIRLSILRPTMIYGCLGDRNVNVFIKMVDKLPVMPVVNGARYKLQPVHYKDLGHAYYAVLTHDESTSGRDYDLSGGEPIELREMLEEIGLQLGKKVTFVNCPFSIAYAAACGIYLLTLGKVDMREKVQRLCESRAYPHAAATLDFGYRPCAFAEGVKSEIEDYQRNSGKGLVKCPR